MRNLLFKTGCLLLFITVVIFLLPNPLLARSSKGAHSSSWLMAKGRPRQGYQRGHFEDKYRRWESLPPDKRRLLRKRMEEWEAMSPEDRALIRKRFEQWKRLSPEEQRLLMERLRNWHRLSSEEREFIRERFLRE